jgi:hypothetical protein
VDFKAFGKSCLPLPPTEIVNASFSADYKCADLYPDNTTNTIVIPNFLGTCYDRVCRFCNPGFDFVSPVSQACVPGQGAGPARVCVYPGVVVAAARAPWDGNVYYADRVAVWLAVYFPFLVICTVSLAIIAFYSFSSKS